MEDRRTIDMLSHERRRTIFLVILLIVALAGKVYLDYQYEHTFDEPEGESGEVMTLLFNINMV